MNEDFEVQTMSACKDLAKYAHKLGQQDKELHVVGVGVNVNQKQVALIPEGMELKSLDDFLPQFPAIKSVDLTLFDPKSFVAYVIEQKNEHTRIFARIDDAPYLFKAIIDYHGVNGKPADWGKHVVSLQLKLTDQFKVWKHYDNKTFSQEEFAEFLKDHRLDIIDPDNSTILTMVQGLQANVDHRVISKLQTNEGMTLNFEEKVNTSIAGEKITVPPMLTLRIPVFVGSEPLEIQADFKMKVREGRINFSYRLLGVDKLIRDTVTATAEKLEQETDTPVYI